MVQNSGFSFKRSRDWRLVFFTVFISVLLGFILSLGRAFSAEPIPIQCKLSSGAVCQPSDLVARNRFTRYVLLLPAGYQPSQQALFEGDFQRFVESMARSPGSLYATSYSSQIIYIAPWLPGGPLNSATANFAAQIMNHPFRGKATTLNQDAVIAKVQVIRQQLIAQGYLINSSTTQPLAVDVLFNSDLPQVTANAAPPSFLQQPYGISKLLRIDLNSSYTAVHETAHAGLNFLDEYTESGFESLSIRLLDYLTPLALLDESWGGLGAALSALFNTYDYRLSEVLAGNGSENVEVTQFPSRVSTPSFAREEYAYEGGMFFGHGTYRHAGKNIMNSDRGAQHADEGFSFSHNMPQWRILPSVFDSHVSAPRPNDRLRNAGPVGDGHLSIGVGTKVLLYDGDKNHHFFPTVSYDLQAGWYERKWKACWAAFIPYPCYDSVWTTFEKQVSSAKRNLDLRASALYGLANTLQGVACTLGIKIKVPGATDLDFCSLNVATVSQAFLPTLSFRTPYQEVDVPAQQWFTKYYWRFRSWNGTIRSGWTGWSSFERTF